MNKLLQPIAVAAILACLLAGCRSAPKVADAKDEGFFHKLPNPMNWGADSGEPRTGEPDRIVATWVDTVKQTQGQASERGFGGRLYFYDRGPDPIAVEGRLVVYAFDESNRVPTDHQPTRRYVFPPDQLPKNMSVSELGPSYSVWLPWGSVDGPPAEISLIARFEPLEGGGLVVSDQAKQRLPGNGVAPVEGTMIAQQPSPATKVRQAGFEESPSPVSSAPAEEAPRQRLSTTTIRLNR